MDENVGIKEFITNQSVEVSLSAFAANLIFAAFLSYLLSLLYGRIKLF
jgi:hypothetical protein